MATKSSPKKTAAKTVALQTVIREISNKTGQPRTDTGKIVRSHIRKMRERNATALYKEWPQLRKHERNNVYPEMPKEFADKLIAARVASINARRSIA